MEAKKIISLLKTIFMSLILANFFFTEIASQWRGGGRMGGGHALRAGRAGIGARPGGMGVRPGAGIRPGAQPTPLYVARPGVQQPGIPSVQPGIAGQPDLRGRFTQPGAPGLVQQPGQLGLQGRLTQPGTPGQVLQPGQPNVPGIQAGQLGAVTRPSQVTPGQLGGWGYRTDLYQRPFIGRRQANIFFGGYNYPYYLGYPSDFYGYGYPPAYGPSYVPGGAAGVNVTYVSANQVTNNDQAAQFCPQVCQSPGLGGWNPGDWYGDGQGNYYCGCSLATGAAVY